MQEWWNTPKVAWGFLIVGIGSGAVFAYLAPKIGIPICAVLILLGVWLIIRAYINKNKLAVKPDNRVDIRGFTESLSVTQRNGVTVLKQSPQLIIGIHEVNFGVSGDSGYPLLNSGKDKAKWLRLGIVFEGNVHIETLELVISGKAPVPAFEWKPGQSAYYYYFQIPDWVKSKEERTIQIQAFANGIKWGSPDESINFPL